MFFGHVGHLQPFWGDISCIAGVRARQGLTLRGAATLAEEAIQISRLGQIFLTSRSTQGETASVDASFFDQAQRAE